MSWTARITAAPGGNLRLLFPEPVRHIDMDQATARHFATLIATASERKRSTANEATIDVETAKPPQKPEPLPIRAGYRANQRRLAAIVAIVPGAPPATVIDLGDLVVEDVEAAVEEAIGVCASRSRAPEARVRRAARAAILGTVWFPDFSVADWSSLIRQAMRAGGVALRARRAAALDEREDAK